MEKISSLCIVLRSVQYQDRDKIVTALSETHGKISAIAKNAVQSRRFGASLDPFTAGNWSMTRSPGSEMFHLERSEVRRDFQGIRADFIRLSVASFWSELILKLVPENESVSQLFKLHANALATLDESPSQSLFPELCTYLGKYLQLNGTAPQLHACLKCGRAIDTLPVHEEIRMEGPAGGWTCMTCPRQGRDYGFQTLPSGLIRVFRTALDCPIRQSTAVLDPLLNLSEGRMLYDFIEGFCSFHLPGFVPEQFNSLRFLKV